MSRARIRLSSTSVDKLEKVCSEIKRIVGKTNTEIKGPIPLPTEKLKVNVRKAPSGEGRESYEMWEMRIHKRLVDLDAEERALRLIMSIQIPKDVKIEMEIKE